MYLKILFGVTALILTVLLVLRECGITKKMSGMRASDFVSAIAIILLLYIILAFLLGIFLPHIFEKLIMLFFAILPFIIGRIATYEKLKIYSIIQILSVVLSGALIFIL